MSESLSEHTDLSNLSNVDLCLPPKPDHWPTVEELRAAGQRQRLVQEVLAELRQRLPTVSHLTSQIRVI